MQVVVEGESDATVQLHTVLEQLRPVAAYVEFTGAHQFRAVGRLPVNCIGRLGGNGKACLEPQLHIGEAVLDFLVGGQVGGQTNTG